MGVLDNGREWTCSVDVYDLDFGNPSQDDSIQAIQTATYTGTNIKNWKITDTMSANGDVAFGSTGSKALNLELFGLSSKSFGTGAIAGVTLTLVGGGSTKWYFFVDTVAWNAEYGTTTKYTASVTAYDAMYYASGKISTIADVNSTPATIKTVIQNKSGTITQCQPVAQYCIRHARYDLIRTRAAELSTAPGDDYDIYANMFDNSSCVGYSSGKTMDDVCDDSTGRIIISAINGSETITITNGMTGRTLLSRMAALKGKRALCSGYSLSTVGTIDFDDLIGTTYTGITKADVYDNGFVSEGSKRFQYFTNGKVSYGKQTSNGFSTMAIDCPDMTKSQIDSLGYNFARYTNPYEIGKVKFRGDPSLKAGRRVNAPDATGTTHNIVATKVVSNFDGGFYQQIYSEGKSDSDIEFEANSATEKAEEIVDDGGGGGGGGGGDVDCHIVTADIFRGHSTGGGAAFEINMTDYGSSITLGSNSGGTYQPTVLDWAQGGRDGLDIANTLYVDVLVVGEDANGNRGIFGTTAGGDNIYGGITSVGDVQVGDVSTHSKLLMYGNIEMNGQTVDLQNGSLSGGSLSNISSINTATITTSGNATVGSNLTVTGDLTVGGSILFSDFVATNALTVADNTDFDAATYWYEINTAETWLPPTLWIGWNGKKNTASSLLYITYDESTHRLTLEDTTTGGIVTFNFTTHTTTWN